MKTITEVLTEYVAAAFEACGFDRALGVVTPSDRLDLCQFQCNGAFGGAKLYHQAPRAIAEQVAAKLDGCAMLEKTEVAGAGFLNLTLTDEAILSHAYAILEDAYVGVPQLDEKQTVVVDYGGPNVAKPLHIGHLRSGIIGESIKRMAKAVGCEAIGDIHLGDWGLQIGLVITELAARYPSCGCFAADGDENDLPPVTCELLAEVYPFASGKSKEDEDYRRRAQKATADLQNGRPGYIALWKEIMRVSVEDLKKNYEKLNVHFEWWYGESDADRYVDELLRRLTEKKLLRGSEGALVVDLEEETDQKPMPPILIKKSDNSNLYATTDLATIIQREQDVHPDGIWYVVDNRQSLHFEQVFRCAHKAALVPPDCDLRFYGFGTMNGTDGKPFKTRDGGVMKLSDLLTMATDAAMEKLRDSSYLATLSEEEKYAVAEKVGVAAVKFGDLINHRSKDYVFDMDKFLSFEGKTGTYLLYTVTRIYSILKKVGTPPRSAGKIYTDAERTLLLKILMSGDVYQHAFAEKAPNYLCENAYQIASAFSSFYHDNRIAAEPDPEKKAAWMALCGLTGTVLEKHLDILAIEPVENM